MYQTVLKACGTGKKKKAVAKDQGLGPVEKAAPVSEDVARVGSVASAMGLEVAARRGVPLGANKAKTPLV